MAETQYSIDMQKLYVEFMINNPELYTRVSGIIKKEFFDPELRTTVEFIRRNRMVRCPITTNKSKNRCRLRPDQTDDKYDTWFLDEFETFCRHKDKCTFTKL